MLTESEWVSKTTSGWCSVRSVISIQPLSERGTLLWYFWPWRAYLLSFSLCHDFSSSMIHVNHVSSLGLPSLHAWRRTPLKSLDSRLELYCQDHRSRSPDLWGDSLSVCTVYAHTYTHVCEVLLSVCVCCCLSKNDVKMCVGVLKGVLSTIQWAWVYVCDVHLYVAFLLSVCHGKFHVCVNLHGKYTRFWFFELKRLLN